MSVSVYVTNDRDSSDTNSTDSIKLSQGNSNPDTAVCCYTKRRISYQSNTESVLTVKGCTSIDGQKRNQKNLGYFIFNL